MSAFPKFGGGGTGGTGFSLNKPATGATGGTPAAGTGTAKGFSGFKLGATGGGGFSSLNKPATPGAGFAKPAATPGAGFAKPAGTPAAGGFTKPAATPGAGFAKPAGTPAAGGFTKTPATSGAPATPTSSAGFPTGGTGFKTTTTGATASGTKPANSFLTGGKAAAPGAATPTTATPGAKPGGFTMPKVGATTPAAKPSNTAGGFTPGLATKTTLTAASPKLGAGSAAAVKTTYKELEDNLTKWRRELNGHVAKFREQARQVNKWDELLLSNGEKITALYSDVEKVANQQKRLERTLNMIQGQQREIHSLLEPLEEKIKEKQESNPMQYDRYADQERDRTFTMAENIKADLDNMHVHLKEMITRINSLSKTEESDDPIQQIGSVLSDHMVSLQWIDQHTEAVQRRVHQLESSRQAVMQRQTYF